MSKMIDLKESLIYTTLHSLIIKIPVIYGK